MTTGSPASSTATTELVVPRSIPTALAIVAASCFLPSRTGSLCLVLRLCCTLTRLPGLVRLDRSLVVDRLGPSLQDHYSKLEC